MSKISELFRKHRLAAGMTQLEVAKKLGRSRGWYAHLEGGRRVWSARDAVRVSHVLRVPLDTFARAMRGER